MNKTFIFFLLFPIIALGQEFQWEPVGIPFETEPGWEPIVPWYGGNMFTASEFVDLDNDNDYDLVVGRWPSFYLSYYENIGDSLTPNFIFVTDSLDSVCVPSGQYSILRPRFCDLDSDGDQDLVIWNQSSSEFFFENQGTVLCPQFVYITDNLLNENLTGNGLGDFADIDSDGDFDIIVGNYNGDIYYYENIGTPTVFSFTQQPMLIPDINVGDYAHVSLCDIDNDNDYDLFVGNGNGDLYFYRNIGDSVNYNFVYVTDNFANASVFSRCAPTFCDIDGDEDYDLFCGMETVWGNAPKGDITFHKNIGSPANYNYLEITDNFLCFDIGQHCLPCLVDIDNDGDLDLLPGRSGFNMPMIRNIGTVDSPAFRWEEYPFLFPDPGYWIYPAFGDLDADGDYDMVMGTGDFYNDYIAMYENVGTPENPDMILSNSNLIGYWWIMMYPYLVDIDGDGDLDLMVGTENWPSSAAIHFYKNIGTPQRFNFILEDDNYQGITGSGQLRIQFIDYDGDGDYDLFTVDSNSAFKYYENVGTPVNANFVLMIENFGNFTDIRPRPYFCDIDNDGDYDLFAGQDYGGGIKFYRNNEYNSVNSHPQIQPNTFTLHQNYPNPFNPTTTIPFALLTESRVKIAIYNILGQRVAVLEDGILQAGNHKASWNSTGMASGVYLIVLESPGESGQTRKITLLK